MRRWAVGVLVAACSVAVARSALAQVGLALLPPHEARVPAAILSRDLALSVDSGARSAGANSVDDLVAFALATTSAKLHFGLKHRTRLVFDGAEREGNCVEYAELFASVFNRERGGIDARAWVVRSDATLFGQHVGDPAWKDHDWVLVVARTPDGGRRWLFVDPALYDFGLGWDISGAVRGAAGLP
jgi:hypothetical protein